MKKKLNCVLLVEDDEGMNYLNKKMLEEAEITEHIEITWDGREAIDYLTNQGKYERQDTIYPQPDLIFLDINMPKIDGWEFLAEYKQLSDLQKGNIIIVMLTASLNPDDRSKAEKIAEISDFKNKAITIETLEEIMQKSFPDYHFKNDR